MKQQNLNNHKRFHPFYHYFMLPLGLFGLMYSAIHFVNADADHHFDALFIFIAFILIFCTISLIRLYALKVQDRVILGEENFRHYLLTGKPLDNRLRSRQVIALRFASDEEMPALAIRAVEENLKEKDIKGAIVHWRADYKRI
jgi:hypothetical protein